LLVVGIIGLVAGVALLGGATSTADFFAWPIAPPQTARFMGAGYLGTGIVLLAGLWIGSWRAIRLIVPPVLVFATTMVAATLLHADRFRWDRMITWVWLGLYIVIVLGAVAIGMVEARRGTTPEGPIRLSTAERLAMTGSGVAMAAWALAFFFFPTEAASLWPWALSPLTGRVIAGWVAVGAVLALVAARDGSAEDVWLPAAGWALSVGLFVAVSLVYLDAFAASSLHVGLYFAALTLSVLGAIYLVARSRRLLGAIRTSPG
jgi:hypothetical protein